MLLNAAPKQEVGLTASQARLSAADAEELDGLLDEFSRNLDVNLRPTASSIDLTEAVAIEPEHFNFDRLLSLRDQYRSKVTSIIAHMHTSPVAGENR